MSLFLCAIPSADASEKTACHVPHFTTLPGGFRYGFPPKVEKRGLFFARKRIPIDRADVSARILKELNYLLMDRRAIVLLWLARSDSYYPVIRPILKKYKVPQEFLYLAAIESSYNSRALSSAGAFGYWQFIKSTARCGPAGCEEYDWKMDINRWRDERAHLENSTHSAAKYLAWMYRMKKVSLREGHEREGLRNWLLAAAGYNAGPSKVTQRMRMYRATSYWDIPLPIETERYVPRWIALGLIGKYREFYGVDLRRRAPFEFDTVKNIRLRKNLSFARVAKMVESTPRKIWMLNTQVSPEKAVFPAKYRGGRIKHTINVPKGTRKKLLTELKSKGYISK